MADNDDVLADLFEDESSYAAADAEPALTQPHVAAAAPVPSASVAPSSASGAAETRAPSSSVAETPGAGVMSPAGASSSAAQVPADASTHARAHEQRVDSAAQYGQQSYAGGSTHATNAPADVASMGGHEGGIDAEYGTSGAAFGQQERTDVSVSGGEEGGRSSRWGKPVPPSAAQGDANSVEAAGADASGSADEGSQAGPVAGGDAAAPHASASAVAQQADAAASGTEGAQPAAAAQHKIPYHAMNPPLEESGCHTCGCRGCNEKDPGPPKVPGAWEAERERFLKQREENRKAAAETRQGPAAAGDRAPQARGGDSGYDRRDHGAPPPSASPVAPRAAPYDSARAGRFDSFPRRGDDADRGGPADAMRGGPSYGSYGADRRGPPPPMDRDYPPHNRDFERDRGMPPPDARGPPPPRYDAHRYPDREMDRRELGPPPSSGRFEERGPAPPLRGGPPPRDAGMQGQGYRGQEPAYSYEAQSDRATGPPSSFDRAPYERAAEYGPPRERFDAGSAVGRRGPSPPRDRRDAGAPSARRPPSPARERFDAGMPASRRAPSPARDRFDTAPPAARRPPSPPRARQPQVATAQPSAAQPSLRELGVCPSYLAGFCAARDDCPLIHPVEEWAQKLRVEYNIRLVDVPREVLGGHPPPAAAAGIKRDRQEVDARRGPAPAEYSRYPPREAGPPYHEPPSFETERPAYPGEQKRPRTVGAPEPPAYGRAGGYPDADGYGRGDGYGAAPSRAAGPPAHMPEPGYRGGPPPYSGGTGPSFAAGGRDGGARDHMDNRGYTGGGGPVGYRDERFEVGP